jgi:mevalonate kinase
MNGETIQRFYSSGKLLITGEYLVLHGALALAFPTRAGQHLYIHSGQPDDLLHWETSVLSQPWFSCIINPQTWEIIHTDNTNTALHLVRILQAASQLKGHSNWLSGVLAVSEIGFEIAWWARLDPFLLFRMVSQGSGYDIAAARSEGPILFSTGGYSHKDPSQPNPVQPNPAQPGPAQPAPEITRINFSPAFAGDLAFVYLGRKQDSASSVKNFLDHALVREEEIDRVSGISRKVSEAGTLDEYEQLLTGHERILSVLLDRPPVKEVLFRDYPGMVKSLGAWGGDFVHVSVRTDTEAARKYFRDKGLDVFVPFIEMVKIAPMPAEPDHRHKPLNH